MSLDRERSKIKLFIERERKKILLDEWLDKELSNAGYAGVRVVSTPREALGTRIIIYALRPGLVIGRRGAKIKELAKKIEEVFNYKDVNISVYEVEEPELNPRIMAWQIERQLLRGIRYRRVGFWALNVIMNAGAAGVEIVISGKLRTVRSAFEKFTAGTVLKSGDIAKKLVESGTADRFTLLPDKKHLLEPQTIQKLMKESIFVKNNTCGHSYKITLDAFIKSSKSCKPCLSTKMNALAGGNTVIYNSQHNTQTI